MKVCVYGASGDELKKEYFDAASELGRLLAGQGHTLVFGGGAGGLMGACARGAKERGGEIIGIAPKFFDEPGVLYEGCSRFIFTDTMAQRKTLMEDEAEAFIVLPGGIGTFEEFFETLTLKQLGRHFKPMALLNTLCYYDSMMKLLEAAAEGGFLSRSCLELFCLCQTPEEAAAHILILEDNIGGIRRLKDYNR